MASVRRGVAALVGAVLAAGVGQRPLAAAPALSALGMLNLAQRAEADGNGKLAERVLRALTADPSLPIRAEARFRLARRLADRGNLNQAAVLLRSILDDLPTAQPVRLALARIQERLGDEAGARRSLRQVQAGGLPSDVAQFVDRWSLALHARKPFGSSIEVAIAPDSNINRATASPYLRTVLGDFELDTAARRRSGVGLAVRGQVYARLWVDKPVELTARIQTKADLYRRHRFNHSDVSIASGPEFNLGSTRVTVEGTGAWYRSDGRLYASTLGANLVAGRPLDRRSRLEVTASVDHVRHALNRLESGTIASLSLNYERALSTRIGIAVGANIQRRSARDPGYSARSAQLSLTAYREVGAATLIGSLRTGLLEADEALWLYPNVRHDRSFGASIGMQLRKIEFAGFSPIVRLSVDRTKSSIALYDTRATRTEFGLAKAF